MRLYDSKSQSLRDFTPLHKGTVGMYVCGPTVQSSPHIGHLRSALVYDQLRRWLEHSGHAVTLVRNVTDIDDKVLDNAAGTAEPWWALAYRMELEFTSAYNAIGIAAPTYEPRATAHIPEMIALIERLIAAGHAYQATDGSADVYFDTSSWQKYGELTNQTPADMEDAADADPRGKRSPQDFALWKSAKKDEPATAIWQTPWGAGRPGWHIECSAMSTKYLGAQFDIHGGGLDLRFPHHENELAQSSAAGDDFANYWLHNGLVHVGGQKMSKSLGNSFFAAELLAQARPIVVRYFLGSAHYRSTLELHETALAEAAAAFERIEGFLDRAARASLSLTAGTLPAAFTEAMNDDMSIPQALAVLHDTVREGNSALDAGDNKKAQDAASQVVAMLDVLGLNPAATEWASEDSSDAATAALDALIAAQLQARADARAAKDFAASDRIRDELAAAGVVIEDTPQGAKWSLNG